MIEDLNNQLAEYFTASSRDLTPASARHAAHVLYVPVSRDAEISRRCARVLSDAELQRAGRLATTGARALFKQRRAFRRFCGALALGSSRPVSQVDFIETQNGRPHLAELPDCWFSFSSCRFGFVGTWSSTHGIGVDFEDQTRDPGASELAQAYFSVAEAEAVAAPEGSASLRKFIRLWCLKEAALKSIGEGLPFGLDAFEFQLEPDLRVIQVPPGQGGAGRFDAHVIDGTDGCTALVIRRLTG
jgi:phosphopantetheinyl transferase